MEPPLTDDWSDLVALPANPIKEAVDCGAGMDHADYSKQPGPRGSANYVLSGADIAEFERCPHRWVRGYRDEEETTSTEWGSLVDFLLTGGKIEDRYAKEPITYVNYRGEEKPWNYHADVCKEWRSEIEAQGLSALKSTLLDEARIAVDLMLSDDGRAALFRDSRKQVMITGRYHDADTGIMVPLKCLIDLVPPSGFLADLKTCRCAHPKAWTKHVYQFGYHVQAARHLDLWNAASGENRREFRHIIQENFKPYEIGQRQLSTEFLDLGRQTYVRALKQYAQCIKTGVWPRYDESGHPNDVVIDGYLLTQPEAWMVAA
jgi:hypothetical protein